MRKSAVLLLFVAVAIVIASLYGVATHQVTYSVSPEYYTKFKFIQLNLADTLAARHMTQPRSAVVIAGVKTSWIIGACIGAILGLIALVFPSADTMFSSAIQSLGITVLITALIAFGGYAFSSKTGYIGLGSYNTLPPHLPNGLVDRRAFLIAGSFQYATLVGAAVGLTASLLFLLIRNNRLRRHLSSEWSPTEEPPAEPSSNEH